MTAADVEAAARTPLAGRQRGGGDDFHFQESPFCGKIILRGEGGAFLKTTAEVLTFAPPETPNTAAQGGGGACLWLGPDERIVWCAADARAALQEKAEKAFAAAGLHAAAVDVSDYYTIIRAGGARLWESLAAFCPLDFSQLPAGGCAQTRFGNAHILLYRVEGAAVDIQVRWSFADYLWRLFSATYDALPPDSS